MKYRINSVGFPISNYISKNIKIIKKNNIFLLNRLLRRNINICFKLNNFKIIDYWYLDKTLEKQVIKKILKFNILIFYIKNINIFFNYYYKFFIKKNKYYLTKDEFLLLGPFSHSFSHQLHEFIPRILYLEMQKKKITVYVPDTLNNILSSNIFSKLFHYCKIKYYSSKQNCIFYNANYVTHFDNRCNCTSKIKKINKQYKKILNLLRDEVNKKIPCKFTSYKYILVSRKNSVVRKLLNENQLFKKLKNIGFKLVEFEKYSFDDQFSIASNCKIMLGYHGAGLTNLLFMKPGSKLIEIMNKFYDHPHMEIFSNSQDLEYKKFFCTNSLENKDGICDINEIYNYISKYVKYENIAN